jgi:hypothetical protein
MDDPVRGDDVPENNACIVDHDTIAGDIRDINRERTSIESVDFSCNETRRMNIARNNMQTKNFNQLVHILWKKQTLDSSCR